MPFDACDRSLVTFKPPHVPSARGVAQWSLRGCGIMLCPSATGGADMHMHVIAGFTAALAVTSAAVAAEKTMNLSRNAKSGVDSPLAYSGRWDRNCNGITVTVTITRQPANGTVSLVDADETIAASTPASGSTG